VREFWILMFLVSAVLTAAAFYSRPAVVAPAAKMADHDVIPTFSVPAGPFPVRLFGQLPPPFTRSHHIIALAPVEIRPTLELNATDRERLEREHTP
jgi:hypothetical protein